MSPLTYLRSTTVLGIVLLGSTVARANTFVVTSTANTDGKECGIDCTLRQAINASNEDKDEDTIVFDEKVFATKQTIRIEDQGFYIKNNLTIIGPNKPGSGVTIEASDACHIAINVNSFEGQTVNFSNLTVKGGKIGLKNTSGAVNLTGCTFSEHETGISNYAVIWITSSNWDVIKVGDATLIMNDCTVCNNSNQGISNYLGITTVNSCTIANNDIGIEGVAGDVNYSNSIIVANKKSAFWGYDSIDGSSTIKFSSGKYARKVCDFNKSGKNIVNGTAEEAGLDPKGLQDNGGPTPTIALIKGSKAIDVGENTVETDQRGIARNIGGKADLGAFEYQGRPATTPPMQSEAP